MAYAVQEEGRSVPWCFYCMMRTATSDAVQEAVYSVWPFLYGALSRI